jgi:NAD(P)-dependent dehydrogenase (short-subunit alcohol dehydrogenase family)
MVCLLRFVDKVRETYDKVDVVINNAASGHGNNLQVELNILRIKYSKCCGRRGSIIWLMIDS